LSFRLIIGIYLVRYYKCREYVPIYATKNVILDCSQENVLGINLFKSKVQSGYKDVLSSANFSI